MSSHAVLIDLLIEAIKAIIVVVMVLKLEPDEVCSLRTLVVAAKV